jgi:hypothetical protein
MQTSCLTAVQNASWPSNRTDHVLSTHTNFDARKSRIKKMIMEDA